MVGVTRFKLNAQLARYLRKHPEERAAAPSAPPAPPSYQSPHRWRLRDRLSEQDIADLIAAFKAGTPKHILAKRYGVNKRSLKKLLREEGVKRRSRWDRDKPK